MRLFFYFTMCVIMVGCTFVTHAQIVIHKDLLSTTEKNLAWAALWNDSYETNVKKTKKYRDSALAFQTATMELQKISYNALVTANEYLKATRALKDALALAPIILSNLSKATLLAAKHPLVLAFHTSVFPVIVGRVTDIKQSVDKLALKETNSKHSIYLITQSDRLRIINGIVDDIHILNNLVLVLLERYKNYNLQALYNDTQISWLINLDKGIANDILNKIKSLK